MIGYKTTPAITLSAYEVQALTRFVERHKCAHDLSIEYSTASGIGRNTVVRCRCGKAEEDITDYGAW